MILIIDIDQSILLCISSYNPETGLDKLVNLKFPIKNSSKHQKVTGGPKGGGGVEKEGLFPDIKMCDYYSLSGFGYL